MATKEDIKGWVMGLLFGFSLLSLAMYTLVNHNDIAEGKQTGALRSNSQTFDTALKVAR